MNRKEKISAPVFQVFYVSKEASNCPLIADIARFYKKLTESELKDSVKDVTISLRYGLRILINAKYSDAKEIKREDFLEIADYDPMKNLLLIIGPGEPKSETPLNWFVHHARNEIHAAVLINSMKLDEKIIKKLPATKKEHPLGSFEQVKEVLGILKDNKIVFIKNQGVLFVGNSLNDVEKLIFDTIGD